MARRRTPTIRYLVAPVLLFAVLVAGLQVLERAAPREADPALVVGDDADFVPAEPERCSRSDEPALAERIRAQVGSGDRVSSAMVNACPIAFDGLRVRYVGELVGDLLERDGGAWVQVNDDDYALEVGPLPAHDDHRGANSGLSVWLPTDTLSDVTGLGRPGRRGDVVELTGAIVRTDPADGGGLTLRADELVVLAPSTAVPRPVDPGQLWLAVGATLAALTFWLLRRGAARR